MLPCPLSFVVRDMDVDVDVFVCARFCSLTYRIIIIIIIISWAVLGVDRVRG